MSREPGSVPFQLDRLCVTGALNTVAVCMQTLTVPHVEGMAGRREGERERESTMGGEVEQEGPDEAGGVVRAGNQALS